MRASWATLLLTSICVGTPVDVAANVGIDKSNADVGRTTAGIIQVYKRRGKRKHMREASQEKEEGTT